MSFTSNYDSSLKNELNGYSASGPTASKTAPKTTSKNTDTASKTTVDGSGVTSPAQTTTTTTSTAPNIYVPSTDKPSYDYFYGLFIPIILLLIILWGFWKFLVNSIRKNPPYGGYAHKHKRMHPGVPKPKVFK